MGAVDPVDPRDDDCDEEEDDDEPCLCHPLFQESLQLQLSLVWFFFPTSAATTAALIKSQDPNEQNASAVEQMRRVEQQRAENKIFSLSYFILDTCVYVYV